MTKSPKDDNTSFRHRPPTTFILDQLNDTISSIPLKPSVIRQNTNSQNSKVQVDSPNKQTPTPSKKAPTSKQDHGDEPKYTSRLVPKVYAQPWEVGENFDEEKWYKKTYGEDVLVLPSTRVPEGWILVLDPHPPPKVKKRWDRYEGPSKDPNWSTNINRADNGLPPKDSWNIGVEYTWDEKDLCYGYYRRERL